MVLFHRNFVIFNKESTEMLEFGPPWDLVRGGTTRWVKFGLEFDNIWYSRWDLLTIAQPESHAKGGILSNFVKNTGFRWDFRLIFENFTKFDQLLNVSHLKYSIKSSNKTI